MTMMTEPRDARRGRRTPAEGHPRVRRRTELWILGIGLGVATVCLGGFSLVMNGIDAATFEESVAPVLLTGEGVPAAEGYEVGKALGAWFGFTLIAVLLLGVVSFYMARLRPWRRTAAWWIGATGLVCLLGSQLILFPVAFIFFVSAGLFALRPITDGSTS